MKLRCGRTQPGTVGFPFLGICVVVEPIIISGAIIIGGAGATRP